MDISICSYSFHRLLAAGRQDIFQYITDCKDLGCTLLDPWNAHLSPLSDGEAILHAGKNPGQSHALTAADGDYIDRVKQAADAAGLPFGCIAIDGAHIYEPTPEARDANRARALRWLDVAARLRARQIRIDAGGAEKMTEEQFSLIVEGYKDLIARARPLGVQILMENHWGPSRRPENVVRIMEAVGGLGLLFDTFNWAPDQRGIAWQTCAQYARCTHIKTFCFDAAGNEVTENVATAIDLLRRTGFTGPWGVESVPGDGDEYAAARKTIALIRRLAGG
jgi:sugar phosphate isomerase/epimerase